MGMRRLKLVFRNWWRRTRSLRLTVLFFCVFLATNVSLYTTTYRNAQRAHVSTWSRHETHRLFVRSSLLRDRQHGYVGPLQLTNRIKRSHHDNRAWRLHTDTVPPGHARTNYSVRSRRQNDILSNREDIGGGRHVDKVPHDPSHKDGSGQSYRNHLPVPSHTKGSARSLHLATVPRDPVSSEGSIKFYRSGLPAPSDRRGSIIQQSVMKFYQSLSENRTKRMHIDTVPRDIASNDGFMKSYRKNLPTPSQRKDGTSGQRVDIVPHDFAPRDGPLNTYRQDPTAPSDRKDKAAHQSVLQFYQFLSDNQMADKRRPINGVSDSSQIEDSSSQFSVLGKHAKLSSQYDHLIKVVMDTKDGCGVPGTFDILMAVHTAPTHFAHRQAYRWLYGDASKTRPWRVKLVFFIGLVTNSTLQDQLVKENQDFGDLVQGSFYDAYGNMTYKAVMVYDWLDRKCQNLSAYLYRVDDDVFINIERTTRRLRNVFSKQEKAFMCHTLNNDPVARTGKWAVPRSLVPEEKYEFMRCLGYFVVVSADLIHEIAEQVKRVPFFWIDDVVVYGIVPDRIGNVRFYRMQQWMAGPLTSSNDLISCYEMNGRKCHFWIGIVQNPEDLKLLYQHSRKKLRH